MESIRISVGGGLELAADVDGPAEGPTVALFHGGGQTRHSWAATTAVLAANGWRAATVELRGHGDSDWAPDGDYSMDAFAADARAAAAALGGPPILVGASLGGLSCMVAVTEAPDPSAVARGLVLVDVAHEMEEVGKARIATFMAAAPDGFASLEEAADAIAAYNPNRPRPKDLSGLAKNLRQREDGRWAWHWDPEFIHGQQGSTDETRSAVIDPTRLTASVDALASIGQPTLLVRGRTSDLLSEEGAQDFLRRVPHAEYADVAGAGHMVAGDRNEVFNRAILDFLDRHRA